MTCWSQSLFDNVLAVLIHVSPKHLGVARFLDEPVQCLPCVFHTGKAHGDQQISNITYTKYNLIWLDTQSQFRPATARAA